MDEAIVRAVNGWAADPTVAAVAVFLSSAWLPALVWSAAGLFLARRRRFAAMVAIALALGGADLVNSRGVKPLVDRARPCRALEGLVLPDRCGTGKSFASSHTAVATAFVVSAAPVVPWGWAIFTPLAALVAGSRVLLGQHYPTDLLGGALIGALVGLGAHVLRRRLEARVAARGGEGSGRDASTA